MLVRVMIMFVIMIVSVGCIHARMLETAGAVTQSPMPVDYDSVRALRAMHVIVISAVTVVAQVEEMGGCKQ